MVTFSRNHFGSRILTIAQGTKAHAYFHGSGAGLDHGDVDQGRADCDDSGGGERSIGRTKGKPSRRRSVG